MTYRPLLPLLLSLSLLVAASAEAPKVERAVGSDGVPVITIKGERPAPAPLPAAPDVVNTPRKPFKVYELEGPPAPAEPETKVVVVSSPPPIAPAGGYRSGWDWGYGGWYTPPGGYYPGGLFPGGYLSGGRYCAPTGGLVVNYNNPPVNYQNPPVNYQNPPVNYRPLTPINRWAPVRTFHPRR